MSNHRFTLEPNKKYACPNCNAPKKFARYVDTETGKHLGASVGRCNREINCQYHFTPKQYFADNPQIKAELFDDFKPTGKRSKRRVYAPTIAPVKTYDVLTPDIFKSTLRDYRENGLARFLFSLIEESEVDAALKRYGVGSWINGETIFWQIDNCNRIRTGKIIRYDPLTGKRSDCLDFVHAALMREPTPDKPLSRTTIEAQRRFGKLSEDFEVNSCFFGEHLLSREISKPVAIVESEKTAVIASIFQPSFVWLAIGGKSYLNTERLRKLTGRKVVLFPDADAFAGWNQKAIEAVRAGLDVVCSNTIESFATAEEKRNGFDIADYFLSAKIAEREHINRIIDEILNDPELLEMLEERLAIMEFEGDLTVDEIETAEFLRSLAIAVYTENAARRISMDLLDGCQANR